MWGWKNGKLTQFCLQSAVAFWAKMTLKTSSSYTEELERMANISEATGADICVATAGVLW